jgi:sugar-specific transcriptional regulator TrmB
MNRNVLIEELEEFLKALKLSNYEIRAYLTLLQSTTLTAKEISHRSNIPTGRIYDVLDDLNGKGIIEVKETRPKSYMAHSPNMAFKNLINHIRAEDNRKISSLYDKAKSLESKIDKSQFWLSSESQGTFWSTAFGTPDVMRLYIKKIEEVQDEILMTGFLNRRTIKVLPMGKPLFKGMHDALNRGVKIKYLWSFEYDHRPLTDEQIEKKTALFIKLKKTMKELYKLSPEQVDGLEIKYLYRNFPTYFDILDKKRVLIKLQNPMRPSQFFACINVLDLNLAKELREKFQATWLFESFDID